MHHKTLMILLTIITSSGLCLAQANGPSAGSDAKPEGVHLFTAGHSLHWYVPDIVSELAAAYGIEGHEQVGIQRMGVSRTIQQWEHMGGNNPARQALAEGDVDVLTLSPIQMPDEGIDNFVKLGLDNNPDMKFIVQISWGGPDIDNQDFDFSLLSRQTNREKTPEQIRTLNVRNIKAAEEQARKINEQYRRQVVYLVPTSQAHEALRIIIYNKEIPGLEKQAEMFADTIGHPTPPVEALNAYLHFAVIYGRSPVGLPIPSVLKNTGKPEWNDEQFNLTLQKLAWETVVNYPPSGVDAQVEPGTTEVAQSNQDAAPQQAIGMRRGRGMQRDPNAITALEDLRIRDICILPDKATNTYYMVGPGGRGIVQYTSKDLKQWQGPRQLYSPAADVWGDIPTRGIWAPEIHKYRDKYYLFFTFSTNTPLADTNPPTKPPLSRRPLVYRGSTIAVSDSPTGPFEVVQDHAIPPSEMMTLDGTLWVEDGQPYMVFAHEWVQITTGTMEAIKLKDDLTGAIGEPFLLFDSNDAPWAKVQPEGCIVTDGPFLLTSKSGKLFMVWSSFDGEGRYNVGLAISDSGKLAGPWRHQAEALFVEHGGHPMLFRTFEGQLMLLFHAPNEGPTRPRIFELEDTGETLKVLEEFTSTTP